MLAEDPEEEYKRLVESGADEADLKLPVRMNFTEFSALVEIVRMHKKKFKVYERKSQKHAVGSNSAAGTRRSGLTRSKEEPAVEYVSE
jgi:hypothetical protein